MIEIGLIVAITTVLYLGAPFGIRALARIPFRWAFIAAGTFGLVVTEDDGEEDGSSGAGNLVGILHAIPGKVLVKASHNIMDWELVDGPDPDHSNDQFKVWGVQDMGSIFYDLRTCVDKHLRFAQDDGKLEAKPKKNKTKNVYFSGDMAVKIAEADTSDGYGFDLEMDLIFERTFPARSILRLADAPAFLSSLVESDVNQHTVGKPVTDFYSGKAATKNRARLANDIFRNPDFKEGVRDQLGLTITKVSIRVVKVSDAVKKSLTAKEDAANTAKAEKEKVRQQAENTEKMGKAEAAARKAGVEVDAWQVQNVLLPLARDGNTVAVAMADALIKNKTITVWAPGQDKMVPLQTK